MQVTWLVLLILVCCSAMAYETINYTTTVIASCPKASLSIYKTAAAAPVKGKSNGVIIAFPGTAFNVPGVFTFEPQAFANLGYTFYQVNTRVYTTHHTKARCAMQDGKDAFKYIFHHLVEPNTKIYIYASSAGGAISLNMLNSFGPQVTAITLVGPLVDIVAFYNLGGQRNALPTKSYAHALSPLRTQPAQSKIPPILAMVGDKDIVTPFKPNLIKYMNLLAKKEKESVEIISADSKKQVSPAGKFKIVYYTGGEHGFQDTTDWIKRDLVQRADAWFNTK